MTSPEWYGRKPALAPLTDQFIRAIALPRADGLRSLTPPPGSLDRRIWLEALGGLAALASLGGLFWWLALRG